MKHFNFDSHSRIGPALFLTGSSGLLTLIISFHTSFVRSVCYLSFDWTGRISTWDYWLIIRLNSQERLDSWSSIESTYSKWEDCCSPSRQLPSSLGWFVKSKLHPIFLATMGVETLESSSPSPLDCWQDSLSFWCQSSGFFERSRMNSTSTASYKW